MVNIEPMWKFRFMDTAGLAAIVVPFARLAFLADPIGSVFAKITTFPTRVGGAKSILRTPFPDTSIVTEMMFVSLKTIWGALQRCSASFARNSYAFVEHMLLAAWHTLTLPFSMTCAIAEMKCRLSNPVWLSFKDFAALIASHFNASFLHKQCLLSVLVGLLAEGVPITNRRHGKAYQIMNQLSTMVRTSAPLLYTKAEGLSIYG